MADYYEILRIRPDAPAEEVQEAYRRLAHKYHPDMAGGDAERFKKINVAYEVLHDPEKRKAYDRGLLGESPKTDSFSANQAEFEQAEYKMENGDLAGAENIFERLAVVHRVPAAWTYLGGIKFEQLLSGKANVQQVLDCFNKAAALSPTEKQNYQAAYRDLSLRQIEIFCNHYLQLKKKASELNRRGLGSIALGGISLMLGNQSKNRGAKILGDAGAAFGGYGAYNNFSQKNAIKNAMPFLLNTINELIRGVRLYCTDNQSIYEPFSTRIAQISGANSSFRDFKENI